MTLARELQWRRTGEDDWRPGPRLELGDDELLTVEGLEPGLAYDFRVRAVDERSEAAGPWHLRLNVLPEVPDEAPDPPTDLRLAGGCLTWRPPPQPVVGYLLRSHPDDDDHFGSAEPVNGDDLVQPPVPLCSVPTGRRTLLVQAVDEYGSVSTTAVMRTDRAPMAPDHEHVLEERDERALLWPETPLGASVDAGDLVADADTDVPLHPGYREPLHLESGGGPLHRDGDPLHYRFQGDHAPLHPRDQTTPLHSPRYRDLAYRWSLSPCAGSGDADAIVTIAVTTTARGWRLLWRARTSPLHPDNPTDALHPADPATEPLHPTFPRWMPWTGALAMPRAHTLEFALWVPGGAVRPRVTGLLTRLSVPTRTQVFESLAVPLGGTRLPLTGTWRRVLRADVSRLDAASGSGVGESRVLDLDWTRGPAVVCLDASGEPETAVVYATVWGY